MILVSFSIHCQLVVRWTLYQGTIICQSPAVLENCMFILRYRIYKVLNYFISSAEKLHGPLIIRKGFYFFGLCFGLILCKRHPVCFCSLPYSTNWSYSTKVLWLLTSEVCFSLYSFRIYFSVSVSVSFYLFYYWLFGGLLVWFRVIMKFLSLQWLDSDT